MNKFVLSALALTTASGLAVAGSGSEEWLTLDREINSLASTLAPQGSGVTVSGFVRSSYSNSSDITVGGNKLGGFNLDNVRLAVNGTVGDFSVHVSTDGSGSLVPGTGTSIVGAPAGTGAFGVLDAYASWNINEMLRLTVGQFIPRVNANSVINENQMLFLNHTANGALLSMRDQGVMLGGQYDMFNFWLAFVNGMDAAGKDLKIAARGEFYAMGGGSASSVEGAYGAAQGNQLTLGLGYSTDDNGTAANVDLAIIAFDATFNTGPISAYAEVVDYDSGALGASNITTFAVQGGFMFVPDKWEGALRYEDLDTATNTTIITAGVNYYLSGHDAKLQANYGMLSDDAPGADTDIFAIGLTASI
jgi:hypothetical protein